jgi:hypothetical protein
MCTKYWNIIMKNNSPPICSWCTLFRLMQQYLYRLRVIYRPALWLPTVLQGHTMVMASGWQSFDRQFEPYLRAFMAAPLRCGLGCRSRTDGRIHRSWILFLPTKGCTLRLTCPHATRSQSLLKMMSKMHNDPIHDQFRLAFQLSSCNSALTLQAFKMSKTKNSKQPIFIF